MAQETNSEGGPATLVAIIFAARRSADRELEREMRRKLEQRFGIKLIFARACEPNGGAQ